MLIEFKVANFRSFKGEQTLSMVASTASEHEATNTFEPMSGFGRLLRSAVVYGPNASGKTSLLRALQFVKSLVLNSAATTAGPKPYSPFKFSASTRKKPSEFTVTFVEDGHRYEYGFTLGAERVEEEWLIDYVHARGRTMFERKYDRTKDKYTWRFSPYLKGQRQRTVWRDATREDALFLSTAVQLNSEQLRPVFDWFQKRLIVIVGAATLNASLTLKLLDEPDGKKRLLPFLREADPGIADLEVKREPIPGGGAVVLQSAANLIDIAGGQPNLLRVTFSHIADSKSQVGLDFEEESNGTQILFRTAGAWLNVFKNGEVLLFDELDTSLHPLLSRFLINRFHSETTNVNNAQLIFSTHNTNHLDQSYFRRDQIWFVEKGEDLASKLYPLTDFKPRNDEKLETWYMRGRYGALPILEDVD